MINQWILAAFACLLGTSSLLADEIAQTRCVVDDKRRQICLDRPAQRIATLSPGATELMFAAGGGDQVVAVVAYSDYPLEAQQRESLGSHTRLDIEKLFALQPDLVIAWVTGNPAEQMERLEALGLNVFYLEPRRFADVSSTLLRLAHLAGSDDVGQQVAQAFEEGINSLQQRYQNASPVRVFYQVWNDPIMSVNHEHLIHQVIELCGGENVFADLPRMIPRLDTESILSANPEAILAGGMGEENQAWLDHWQQYPHLKATADQNLYFIPPSLIQRPTPRLLQGAERFCQALDEARAKRQ
ncbi:cobalamin-binding protein [Nitrincola tibetensis]|uniref:Cobalamin-binding protein n=1 Tax=Nitrincola tibetensis TaxID=2219697 RepID=A0A364NRZ3_9GAMM|nr:cobalamin-binding protein [Nitrincola tibetensis]RAU19856.1 cobalamin-binding protein [Nitrincola tibetensis]